MNDMAIGCVERPYGDGFLLIYPSLETVPAFYAHKQNIQEGRYYCDHLALDSSNCIWAEICIGNRLYRWNGLDGYDPTNWQIQDADPIDLGRAKGVRYTTAGVEIDLSEP